MDLFTYLMAKNNQNTYNDLFSYLLGKSSGQSGTYTTYTGTTLNILNTLRGKIKNIELKPSEITQDGTPTPDAPIEVNTVTGNNTITISNANNTQNQNYSINLGNIEYCKLGTAEDKTYRDENGDWYFEEHVAKKILNGTENWILSSAYTNETILSIFVPIGGKNNSIYKSNKLPFMSIISPTATEEYVGANGTSVRIGIFKSRLTEGTTTAFKTWLSQNNIKVYFELATPTTTQITDTTLVTQLENLYQNAQSYNGTTNVTQTNTNLPFVLNMDVLIKQ